MQSCLERAFLFLKEQGEADRLRHVLVESRGPKEDADLELAFGRIRDGANAGGRRTPFQVVFVDKTQNLAGPPRVDLVCHPIGRHLLEPEQPNRADEAVEAKIRHSGAGTLEGYGLKTLP